MRENRAVDASVQHREDGVPGGIREQPLERREDAVVERADRLAAEEARLLGDDVLEGGEERPLQLVLGEVGEPAALQLAQVRPRLRLRARRDDRSRLERPPEAARQHAVEPHSRESRRRGAGLLEPCRRQRHRVGAHRAPVHEVRHRRMAHEVDAPPGQE